MKVSESAEQSTYFDWVRIKAKLDPRYENIIAIPNQGGGGIQNIARGRKMQAEGCAKGFPDVAIFVPLGDERGYFLSGQFLEFKVKPNKQSPEQKAWQARLEKAGYLYKIVWSADEAIKVTEEYLG